LDCYHVRRAMIDTRAAAKKTLMIFAILTSFLCSLSGGLGPSLNRHEAVSDSAVNSTRTSARTYALVNAQNARAEVHLSKPKSAKHSVSQDTAPHRLCSLNASARLFLLDENLVPRYVSQYRTQHTGRAPPHFN